MSECLMHDDQRSAQIIREMFSGRSDVDEIVALWLKTKHLRCVHFGRAHVKEFIRPTGERVIGRWLTKREVGGLPFEGIVVTVDTADAEFNAAVERMLADIPSILH